MVIRPPRMEPNARGISTMDGERLFCRAVFKAIGMTSARAPTLFMNPDNTATSPVSDSTCMYG